MLQFPTKQQKQKCLFRLVLANDISLKWGSRQCLGVWSLTCEKLSQVSSQAATFAPCVARVKGDHGSPDPQQLAAYLSSNMSGHRYALCLDMLTPAILAVWSVTEVLAESGKVVVGHRNPATRVQLPQLDSAGKNMNNCFHPSLHTKSTVNVPKLIPNFVRIVIQEIIARCDAHFRRAGLDAHGTMRQSLCSDLLFQN